MISVILVLLYDAAWAAIVGHRPQFDWRFFAFLLALVGLPFFALAVAGTRDWLAWLIAFLLTLLLWGYQLYDLSRDTGFNFALGLILTLPGPLVIAAVSLVTAGIRGRIPEWGLEDESASSLGPRGDR